MSSDPQPDHFSNSQKMADVFDRLAAVLEQQARTLLELKADVGTLINSVRQVEARLAAAEKKTSPSDRKAAAKKRSK